MQQVICTALDYLSHGDGLPGEEVGAAAGDAAGWGVGEAAGGRPGACGLASGVGAGGVEGFQRQGVAHGCHLLAPDFQ